MSNYNIWQRIRNAFGKKNEAVLPESVPQHATETNTPEWVSIYGHGFQNGLYGISIDQDSFPSFLEHSNELEKIQELQKLNQNEIETLEGNLNSHKERYLIFAGDQISADERLSTLQMSSNDKSNKLSTIQNRNNELFTKREHLNPEYGWIPALLFLAAGTLFILGDIAVTSDITANGLDMKGNEKLLFSIGLALTVFLIKPLLDRLFEKPFQKAGHDLKKTYKIVLLFITVIGLVMLGLLGKFRADAKTLVAQLNEVNLQIGQLTIDHKDYNSLAAKANNISLQLADNGFGQWGIILSTLVFAIGGAMCLAVAFPSLTQLCNKYWFIPIRRWLNKFLIRSKEKQIEQDQSNIESCKAKRNIAFKKLDMLEIETLKQDLVKAKITRMELMELYSSVRYKKESDLYKDGYNRGEKYSMEGDLKFKIHDPLQLYNYSKENSEKKEVKNEFEKRKYTRRPFVKIRKMIADNYNKKQNPIDQDGTEFEIVS